MYKQYFKESKKLDPYADLGFEKKFVGKSLNSVKSLLSKYSLKDEGISPVIDRNYKIVGFVYDQDNDGTFQGDDIDDFGLTIGKDFDYYEM